MRIVNHTALAAQKSADQPSWLVMASTYLFLAHGFFALTSVVDAISPCWVAWRSEHDSLYRLLFMGVHILLVAVVSAFVMRRYAGALYSGFAVDARGIWRVVKVGLLLALPLAVYHLGLFVLLLESFNELTHAANDGSPAPDPRFWVQMHRDVWAPLGWGTDGLGVVLAATASLVFPFFEEWLVSGYLCNKLCRRLPVALAALICAGLFAALHVHKTGLSSQLLFVFLGGLTAVVARLVSGLWLAGLVAHWILNLTVFLPKLLIAMVWLCAAR